MILNQVKQAKQTNIKTLLFINLTLATYTKSAISSIFKIQKLFFVYHAIYMSSLQPGLLFLEIRIIQLHNSVIISENNLIEFNDLIEFCNSLKLSSLFRRKVNQVTFNS